MPSPGALVFWGACLLVLSIWLSGKYDDDGD